MFKVWFNYILLFISNSSLAYQLSVEVADSQVPNVVLSVFGLRTYFESCSDVFLTDFEYLDICLYYML